MPRLRPPRQGTVLVANRRSVPFSLWPVDQGAPRAPVQLLLFAIDPWVIMRRVVLDQVVPGPSRDEALSYIDQAADFFNSALASDIRAARPVQLYYSYLNIVKSFIICRGVQQTLPKIQHGLNEDVYPNGNEFVDAYVRFWRSPGARGALQAFDEFANALGVGRPANQHQCPIAHLVPQILPGHRLWASAAVQSERFISVQRIEFVESKGSKRAWLRIFLFVDDVTRLRYTQNAVLTDSRLSVDFWKVKCTEKVDGRSLVCFEQRTTTQYVRHGVDVATGLADRIRDRI